MRPFSVLPILPSFSDKLVPRDAIASCYRTHTVDEAVKLNIEDKDETSPRRPSTKRARPAEEQPTGDAAPAESAPEGASRPKRKAAPAPATETPVRSRGKKAKTETAAPAPAPAPAPAAAAAPASKGKKGGEKKASAADDEAVKDQQEADEVDALADEPAENGPANPDQGAIFLPLPFFFSFRPCVFANTCCIDFEPGLQKLLTRLDQTLRQAVLSSRALKLKPSLVKPLRRSNTPFSLDLVPEPMGRFFLFKIFVYLSLSRL